MNDYTANGEKMTDIDWENRVLCSDESCIGVIGPDGRCKECGRAYEGELPVRVAEVVDTDSDEVTEQMDSPGGKASETEAPIPEQDDQANADDWEKRTLCSDESCIGVIGPDGRCKECGKPYAG